MKNLSFILLLGLAPLSAQQNGIEQSSELLTVPAGDKFLRWYGHLGRSYFVQVSDANTPLAKWAWAPIIEQGNDEEISHEVGGTAANGFFRLKFTDQVPGPGQTLETADFDGDGISNWDEITAAAIATDPLAHDTDNDGFSDGDEIAVGTSPLDATSYPLKVVQTTPSDLLNDNQAYGHPSGQPLLLYLNKEIPASVTTLNGPWLYEANGTPNPAPGTAIILPGRKAVAFIPANNSFKTWEDLPNDTPIYQINFDTATTGIPHLLPLYGTFTITSPQGSAACGPWISVLNPGSDYIDFDPSQPIHASWSEPLDAATVIPANITLTAENGTTIATTVAFDYGKDANQMTITPAQTLSPNTRYTVTLGTGFHNLTGKAHNAPRSWSFTTRPVRPSPNGTGPYVTAVSPSDFSFSIAPPASVSITFSEDMDSTTLTAENIRLRGKLGCVIPGSYTYTQATRTLVFTPAEPFTGRTYYSLEFDHAAILSLPQSGNPLPLQNTGNSVFSTAAATNAPANGNTAANAAPSPTVLDPLRLHYTWGAIFDPPNGGTGGSGGSGGSQMLAYYPRFGCSAIVSYKDKNGNETLLHLPANPDALQVKESGDIAPATTVKITPEFVAGTKEANTAAAKKSSGIFVSPSQSDPILNQIIPPSLPGMTYLIFRTTPPEDGTPYQETVDYLGQYSLTSTGLTARCLTEDNRGPQSLYFVPVPIERQILGSHSLLENDYAQALPGQRLILKAQDKYITNYGPPGATLDNYEWPAADLGKTFKDYTVTINANQSPGQLQNLAASDLDQQDIVFYRTKGGDTLAAKANFYIKIDGSVEGAAEAIGKIRIDQPTSSFDLEIGEEKVKEAPDGGNVVVPMFGLYTKTAGQVFRGVKFKGQVATPPGWNPSTWNYTQLIKSRRNYAYQGGALTHRGDGNSIKLDTTYPYSNTYPADGQPKDDVTCGDTPRDTLTGSPPPNQQSTARTQIEAHESFETYIMFKPPGADAREVPLRRAKWQWGGAVSSSNNWTPVNGPESPNSDTAGVEHFDHPQWSDNTSSDIEVANP